MKKNVQSSRGRIWIAIAVALIPIVALSAMMATAMSGNTTADRVLGQPSFTSNAFGSGGAQGLNEPYGVAIDTSVLIFNSYVPGHSLCQGIVCFAQWMKDDHLASKPFFR